ncbi:hypothetical protein WG906_14035 [Pedobacter sp. P351]|uniref:hypothetical protein n=1 Tax=Pedobacter superstes TaxID=3133441 RepID=UPI0030B01E19
MEKDYFDTKNEAFFDALDELFNIRKSKSWDDISRSISLLKVKRTYRIFAELFPRGVDYMQELETLKLDFSSIHYGAIKGSKIIDEIARFSMYSDKIIVFHPLQNPAVTNPNMNPGRNAKYWLPDFMDSLYFYIVIQKWVKAGIVKLIVNPYDYDLELREKVDKQAFERFQGYDKKEIFNSSKGEVLMNLAESLTFTFRNKNTDFIYKSLMEMEQPKFSHEDAVEMAEAIKSANDYRNPLYDKLNFKLNSGMIMPTKGGGPLESILLISEKTGGAIYTPSTMNWSQLQKVGNNDFWTKANHVYSKIPMNFLNNVDVNFALNLRKEDRLAGVRKQLKRIYTELNTLKTEDISESKIRDFKDSFIEEVKTADAEWKEIGRQAEIARKSWLVTSLSAPIVVNQMSILPIIAGSAAWLYKNERSRIAKEELQRAKNPISVFVDLKHQKQNFFTTLKNCLF